MIDLTLIAAIFAIIAAIFSPIITSHIQRKSNLEIKRLDIVYEKKMKAYEEFATAYGMLFNEGDREPYQRFAASIYQAQLYSNSNFLAESNKLIDILYVIPINKSSLEPQYRVCLSILHKDLNLSKPN